MPINNDLDVISIIGWIAALIQAGLAIFNRCRWLANRKSISEIDLESQASEITSSYIQTPQCLSETQSQGLQISSIGVNNTADMEITAWPLRTKIRQKRISLSVETPQNHSVSEDERLVITSGVLR